MVGDVDFVGDRLSFVVEVPQHGVERDAAAGDVTDWRGWRRTILFECRGENRAHLGVEREGHLSAFPYFAPGGGSSSVLYSGVRALDLAMKAARAAASGGGGACVRVATTFTAARQSRCPQECPAVTS